MMKKWGYVALISVIFLLGGCATAGSNSASDASFSTKWYTEALKEGVLRKYINKGEHLIDRNSFGQTPLHVIAGYEDARVVEMIEVLVAGGLDVDSRANHGLTPLAAASLIATPVLLRLGSDINAQDVNGDTALHYAYITAGKAKLLLQAGADASIVNSRKETAKEGWLKTMVLYRRILKDSPNLGPALDKIKESIAVFDKFSGQFSEYTKCKKSAELIREGRLQVECYKNFLSNYPQADESVHVKSEILRLEKTLAKERKAKEQARLKRIAQQACKLKSADWLYLSKSCQKDLAHGYGEAINEARNLKFIGEFVQGIRISGELYADDALMYDGPLKGGRPHGAGTCIHEGEPEECKYYKGKRTDVLYKQRLEFIKQSQLIADSEARMQKSLKESEQRMNNLQQRNNQQAQGKGFGDYAGDTLKKEAAEKATDFLFDSLF